MTIFSLVGLGIIVLCIVVRILVGRFPHSGENTPPMYGDYEAQRHWMEITTNLEPKEWYENSTDNDLSYWGLDYPPLTAYHMLINGYLSNAINASWTELGTSRGEESFHHKVFMRATVLVSDITVYMSAIVYFFIYLTPVDSSRESLLKTMLMTLFALGYPAQILIDHGHFQYNCVFMGLTMWAVILIMKGRQFGATVLFCLALNYKQMALYYALPFFWYLLGKNLRSNTIDRAIIKIYMLAVTVTITFVICWSPFLHDADTVNQVIKRLFPVNRGLFEDKVANIWCCLSVLVKLKQLYTPETLFKLSTGLTLLGSLPCGLHLLWRPSVLAFRHALVTCSLVFFLAGYQVHEKTILVPAVPILMMFREHTLVVNWFVIISTYSLQPLLIKDHQTNPYIALFVIYIVQSLEIFKQHIYVRSSDKFPTRLLKMSFFASVIVCFGLSFAPKFVRAPIMYRDIHAVINAFFCCAHFIFFLGYFLYYQFKTPMDIFSEAKTKKKKND